MRHFCAFFFLFTILTNLRPSYGICLLDRFYVIRHQQTGMVLEANAENQVRLDFFTGNNYQYWKFECSGEPGLLSVLNLATATWLEAPSDNTTNEVYLNKRNLQSSHQQWIVNADGTITNAALKLNLDIESAEAGSHVVVKAVDTNQGSNQQFILQQKT